MIEPVKAEKVVVAAKKSENVVEENTGKDSDI